VAETAQTGIIVDPNQEFTPDDYSAMEQALAVRQARIENALQALRVNYAAAAQTLVSMVEFGAVRAKVTEIIATTPRDDNMALHMDALSATLARIADTARA